MTDHTHHMSPSDDIYPQDTTGLIEAAHCPTAAPVPVKGRRATRAIPTSRKKEPSCMSEPSFASAPSRFPPD